MSKTSSSDCKVLTGDLTLFGDLGDFGGDTMSKISMTSLSSCNKIMRQFLSFEIFFRLMLGYELPFLI